MRSVLLLALVLVFGGCTSRVRLDPRRLYLVESTRRTVELEPGLSTTLVVDRPIHRRVEGLPAVVLVPGGEDPMDRDGTLRSALGEQPLFRILGEELASRGFVVARYDERHVRGPGEVDLRRYVADRDQHTFARDLRVILEAVRAMPAVDRERIFLLGYDEGVTVAAEVASEGAVAGLVGIGTPGMPFRERLQDWFDGMELYLERFAHQGVLDGFTLDRAMHARAANPYLLTTRMLAVSYTRDAGFAIPSPLVDRDRDGLLHLDEEVHPAIPALVDFAFTLGPYGYLAADRALPPLSSRLEELDLPVLLLHGERDAHTPPDNLERILERARADEHTVEGQLFPGLGHTLGRATEPVDDLLRLPEPEALEALVRWLVARSYRADRR